MLRGARVSPCAGLLRSLRQSVFALCLINALQTRCTAHQRYGMGRCAAQEAMRSSLFTFQGNTVWKRGAVVHNSGGTVWCTAVRQVAHWTHAPGAAGACRMRLSRVSFKIPQPLMLAPFDYLPIPVATRTGPQRPSMRFRWSQVSVSVHCTPRMHPRSCTPTTLTLTFSVASRSATAGPSCSPAAAGLVCVKGGSISSVLNCAPLPCCRHCRSASPSSLPYRCCAACHPSMMMHTYVRQAQRACPCSHAYVCMHLLMHSFCSRHATALLQKRCMHDLQQELAGTQADASPMAKPVWKSAHLAGQSICHSMP